MAELYADQHGTDAAAWAMIELGHTDVGDRRRTLRLVRLIAALANRPASSPPAACGTWADTKAAYRFLDNEDIEPEAVQHAQHPAEDPHAQRPAGHHPGHLAPPGPHGPQNADLPLPLYWVILSPALTLLSEVYRQGATHVSAGGRPFHPSRVVVALW